MPISHNPIYYRGGGLVSHQVAGDMTQHSLMSTAISQRAPIRYPGTEYPGAVTFSPVGPGGVLAAVPVHLGPNPELLKRMNEVARFTRQQGRLSGLSYVGLGDGPDWSLVILGLVAAAIILPHFSRSLTR